MKKGFLVCRLNLFKLLNRRLLILLAIEACFIFCLLQPFVDIAQAEGFRLTPFGFTIMQSENIAHLVLLSSAILFLANCPFDDSLTYDILAKSGSASTCLGNILFIGLYAFMYTLFVQLMTFLCILPVVDMSAEWGEGWFKLLDMNILMKHHTVFVVEPFVLSNYTAIEAWALSSVFEWCLITFFGLLSYCMNRLTHRPFGLLGMVAFALLDLTIYNMYPFSWYHFSPVSLAMLTTYQYTQYSGGVTMQYGQLFFLFGIIFLVIACFSIECLTIRKKGVVINVRT